MLNRLLILLVIASSALAQSPTPPGPPTTDAQNKISVNSELVILPVTVKNQFGDLVPDLEQADFHIFDDNIEQSIDVFTVEAFPLSLVVLIDDDLKSRDAAQMTPTLRAITGGISANDEVLICRFDLDFYPGESFTADSDKLWAELKAVQDHAAPSTAGPVPFVTPPGTHPESVGEPKQTVPIKSGSRPTKALDDAIHSAAELLHDRGPTRRKMILIVSDGVNGAQFNRFNYQDTLETLLHDNISVFSLAVGNSWNKKKFQRLTDYSNNSGGDIYYASTSSSIERLYSQITEEARHEYTLAYVPRNATNASSFSTSSTYHRIEVRVNRPAVTIKTRQGYYAAPPSTPSPASAN
jgi:Ca-activated chloride channel homolog